MKTVALLAGAFLSLASGALGQSDLSWRTVEGGGSTFVSAGGYQLGGTVGQADASGRLANGAYSLTGGFWTLASVADLSIVKAIVQDPVPASGTLDYTIEVRNLGPGTASGLVVTDALPAGTIFLSANGPGWTCAHAAGTVTCTRPSLAAGAAPTIRVIAAAPNAILALTNTASVTSTAGDPTTPNASSVTSGVVSPAAVTATKSVTGAFQPGGLVAYEIALANASVNDQQDNPGDELVDTLPSQLVLTGATATAGLVSLDVPAGTVRWNGAVPAHGSVTVRIEAILRSGTHGATVANQANVFFDHDGNGSNESVALSESAGATGIGGPTVFQVAALVEVPALDTLGLTLLAAALAAAAYRRLRRS